MYLQHKQVFPHSSLIEELYQRYWLMIFIAIRQHVFSKEEAEDILLEVFLAALENPMLVNLSEQQQLAWLRRVAYNKCIDAYRRFVRRPAVSIEKAAETLFEDAMFSPEQITLYQEEVGLLRQHFSLLSELQREVLILRFADGLSCAEIAARLHKSEGAIRTLLSRTLNLLRSIYEHRRKGTDHE